MIVKLGGIDPERKVSVTIDQYVPFRIEIAPEVESIDDLFYWRCTNRRHLFELKIVSSSGLIGGASLVLIPREKTRVVDLVSPAALPRRRGVPRVELSPWKAKLGPREFGVDPWARRIDEELPIRFEIGRDGAGVFFGSGAGKTTVSTGAANFTFEDDESLCGLVLTDLSAAELLLLKESFAPTQG